MGIMYIILGILIFLSKDFLLKMVNDYGYKQKQILTAVSLYYIILGILKPIIQIKQNYLINIILIIIPIIIYKLMDNRV